MATLYRCTAPTDWLCPCGRVARKLRQAGEPVAEVRVPQRRKRRDEVRALSGQERVPLLVLDGQVICDSRRIVEYLEHRATSGPVLSDAPAAPRAPRSPRDPAPSPRRPR